MSAEKALHPVLLDDVAKAEGLAEGVFFFVGDGRTFNLYQKKDKKYVAYRIKDPVEAGEKPLPDSEENFVITIPKAEDLKHYLQNDVVMFPPVAQLFILEKIFGLIHMVWLDDKEKEPYQDALQSTYVQILREHKDDPHVHLLVEESMLLPESDAVREIYGNNLGMLVKLGFVTINPIKKGVIAVDTNSLYDEDEWSYDPKKNIEEEIIESIKTYPQYARMFLDPVSEKCYKPFIRNPNVLSRLVTEGNSDVHKEIRTLGLLDEFNLFRRLSLYAKLEKAEENASDDYILQRYEIALAASQDPKKRGLFANRRLARYKAAADKVRETRQHLPAVKENKGYIKIVLKDINTLVDELAKYSQYTKFEIFTPDLMVVLNLTPGQEKYDSYYDIGIPLPEHDIFLSKSFERIPTSRRHAHAIFKKEFKVASQARKAPEFEPIEEDGGRKGQTTIETERASLRAPTTASTLKALRAEQPSVSPKLSEQNTKLKNLDLSSEEEAQVEDLADAFHAGSQRFPALMEEATARILMGIALQDKFEPKKNAEKIGIIIKVNPNITLDHLKSMKKYNVFQSSQLVSEWLEDEIREREMAGLMESVSNPVEFLKRFDAITDENLAWMCKDPKFHVIEHAIPDIVKYEGVMLQQLQRMQKLKLFPVSSKASVLLNTKISALEEDINSKLQSYIQQYKKIRELFIVGKYQDALMQFGAMVHAINKARPDLHTDLDAGDLVRDVFCRILRHTEPSALDQVISDVFMQVVSEVRSMNLPVLNLSEALQMVPPSSQVIDERYSQLSTLATLERTFQAFLRQKDEVDEDQIKAWQNTYLEILRNLQTEESVSELAKQLTLKCTLLDFNAPKNGLSEARKETMMIFSADPMAILAQRMRCQPKGSVREMTKEMNIENIVSYIIAYPADARRILNCKERDFYQELRENPAHIKRMIENSTPMLRAALEANLARNAHLLGNPKEIKKQLRAQVVREIDKMISDNDENSAEIQLEDIDLFAELAEDENNDLLKKLVEKYPVLNDRFNIKEYGISKDQSSLTVFNPVDGKNAYKGRIK